MSSVALAWIAVMLILYLALGMIFPKAMTFFLPKKFRTRITVGIIWVILTIPVIIGSICSDDQWVYVKYPTEQTK